MVKKTTKKTRSSRATGVKKKTAKKAGKKKTAAVSKKEKKAQVPLAPTNYAGFWLRFISYIIDAAALGVVGSGIAVLLFIVNTSGTLNNVIMLLVSWGYFAFMESSSYQGTLGKIIVGLVVTDLVGGRLSFWKATARHFSKYLSTAFLFIGLFMIAFTEKKQGLHDIIAGCLVLKND